MTLGVGFMSFQRIRSTLFHVPLDNVVIMDAEFFCKVVLNMFTTYQGHLRLTTLLDL